MEDKCELCALRVSFDQSNVRGGAQRVEDFFGKLRELQKQTIIGQGYRRLAGASNDPSSSHNASHLCAVNSPNFLENSQSCPHFVLNLGQSTSEAMSLHFARSTDRLTKGLHAMTIALIFLAVLAIAVTLLRS